MRHGFLGAAGGRVEYDEVPGADPAIVLLHEGLGSVGLWRGFHHDVAAATGRRTIVFSRLGHGRSSAPRHRRGPGFMSSEARDVLPEVLAALHVERPVLLGHSDGGSIALLAAASDLPLVGAVVIAPHVFVEDAGLTSITATRAAFDDGTLRARMARHHDDPDVVFGNWAGVWLDPAFRAWDITAELPAITCPVLAVQGTADPYGTVAHVEAVRERSSGPVEVVLLDCGHSPHLERREETLSAVAGFVARISATPSTPPTPRA
ncbi:alpha/beta fold hydrolase [Pseudonocardia sp. N23]|uniref:alpha/beta fold hydrolase n=1 Tax=Pseudonocardia sp. N23 TaxID=1987376 RepID=UPI000BFC7086|nr:alpha/beta hydrolase [Pseudonocardia sp. N23]GAY11609.1 benzoate degradation ring-cleavage hydrolase [Pseudonocardia sp. N23]